jgi:TonB family protein
MKTKLPLLAGLSLVFASVANAQTQSGSWLRYTVKGAEFSVTLPEEPAMKTTDVFITRLQKSRVERLVETKAGDLVYRVYVYENPKPRQSLKDFVAEQIERSDLNLTFERELKVGKFGGQQYSSHDRDFPTTEQYFSTDARLYRFVVRGATADHTGAQPFFSSVALGKKQEGIEIIEGGMPRETEQTIFRGAEVETKVRLISKPEPSYTDEAKQHGLVGTVVLKAIFAASGNVTNIRVVHGLPDGLTERSIAAARQIRFVPATREGRFVSMWMQLEYNFNLY